MSENIELFNRLDSNGDLLSYPSSISAISNYRSPAIRYGALPTEHSEAVNLVQRVFFSQPQQAAPRIVAFTSAEPGAGCSWVCARTGEALANRLEGTVCVVDANLRSPAMHQFLRVNNNCGVAQALLQEGPTMKYTQQTPTSNLWVLTSGAQSETNPLWAIQRLATCLSDVLKQFTYVLIDTPPANLYADFTAVSSIVDGAILVVGADTTHRAAALQAKEALISAKFRLLGAALNRRIFPIPQAIYNKL